MPLAPPRVRRGVTLLRALGAQAYLKAKQAAKQPVGKDAAATLQDAKAAALAAKPGPQRAAAQRFLALRRKQQAAAEYLAARKKSGEEAPQENDPCGLTPSLLFSTIVSSSLLTPAHGLTFTTSMSQSITSLLGLVLYLRLVPTLLNVMKRLLNQNAA